MKEFQLSHIPHLSKMQCPEGKYDPEAKPKDILIIFLISIP